MASSRPMWSSRLVCFQIASACFEGRQRLSPRRRAVAVACALISASSALTAGERRARRSRRDEPGISASHPGSGRVAPIRDRHRLRRLSPQGQGTARGAHQILFGGIGITTLQQQPPRLRNSRPPRRHRRDGAESRVLGRSPPSVRLSVPPYQSTPTRNTSERARSWAFSASHARSSSTIAARWHRGSRGQVPGGGGP